ncbi:DUF742 domain-containing protein [Streptomyces sp. NPDC127044]
MSPQSRQTPAAAAAAETTVFVRTYTLTGGRTRPRHMLSLETVLEPGPGRAGPALPEECGQILALCRQRRLSVAELAGTIGRPVTPVKILISDLLDVRALVVPVTDAYDSSDSPTRQLLEALSAGLKARWPDADAYPKAG